LDAIYLRPAQSQQGGHELMDLNSGQLISRNIVHEIPVINVVIKAVENMAYQQGFKSLKFKSQNGVVYHDADWIAKETLGVMQAMNGNNKEEIRHLWAKAEEFADSLRTGFLKKNNAWYALTSTIMKTMEYPMAVTTIKEHEWNYIVAPILQAGLPRSGIERNFPRDVLFGPSCLQGFGILHPWYHQEIVHLLVCLKQSTIGGITGRQISSSTEQM
jgi:hypothetical protein